MEIPFSVTPIYDVWCHSCQFHRQGNGQRVVQEKHVHCYFYFCGNHVLVGQTEIQRSTTVHSIYRFNGVYGRFHYHGRQSSGFVLQHFLLGHATSIKCLYWHHRLALSNH